MSDVVLELDGEEIMLPESVDVSITQEMESEEDFTQKRSSLSLNLTVPVTAANSALLNTFFDASVDDASGQFRNVIPCVLRAKGDDILIGKALLENAKHNDRPVSFEISLFGENGDWAIANQDMTLFDVLPVATHYLTNATIQDSWNFPASNRFFVYAPIRYALPFGSNDDNISETDYKPSLSIYWLLKKGFELAGYTIQSVFLDSDYFRRLVMPWTWGGFLTIDGAAIQILKFRALNTQLATFTTAANNPYSIIMDAAKGFIVNNETTNGAFDNGGNYSWSDPSMVWTYPSGAQFGSLQVVFRFYTDMWYDITYGTSMNVILRWHKNGALVATENVFSDSVGNFNQKLGIDVTIDHQWTSPVVQPGDQIQLSIEVNGAVGTTVQNSYMQIWMPGYQWHAGLNRYAQTYLENVAFIMAAGGLVNFKNYNSFKDYKWLDLLRGAIDTFDWQIGTDPRNKVVVIEPAHSAGINSYYRNELEFTDKQDLSKVSTIENFGGYKQSFHLDFADDGNDGISKLVAARAQTSLFKAKYKFPSRFQKGEGTKTNRFFSGLSHYDHIVWKSITGVAPQLICLVPENISDTSTPEAAFKFAPKIAYYKGLVSGVGGFKSFGSDFAYLPYLFAVNYKAGGENDPVLTYCDQNINGVFAPGLFRKFFIHRIAIISHGKRYSTWLNLTNTDVMNALHREWIIIDGNKYQLIKVDTFKPLENESTLVVLWQFRPVTQEVYNNTFPSVTAVMTQSITGNSDDFKYAKSLALPSDIPT